jgi:hypothetical protein
MTPSASFTLLQSRVEYLITHARSPKPILGVTPYTPAAFGENYKALYLRDFTYMAESAPQFIPLQDTRAILALFLSHLSPEGLCPERISDTGEVIYLCHGPKPAADCPMFLVKLAAAYASASNEKKYIDTIYNDLQRTLTTAPTDPSTGLVHIDPSAPHTAYGFTDTIAITGHHLFCSLLLRESHLLLSRLARDLSRDKDATAHDDQAQRIAKNLDLLWSPDHQLYFAGSKDCRQPDIWGSAYACVTDALPPARHQQVATSLWTLKDRFLYRSQVRHLPTPENWNRLIVNEDWTSPGKFQNGAYWGTATGWIAEAFESLHPGAGGSLLQELVNDFTQNGIWECIAPDDYHRTPNNVSSACLPYASFKRLLHA